MIRLLQKIIISYKQTYENQSIANSELQLQYNDSVFELKELKREYNKLGLQNLEFSNKIDSL